MLAVVDDFYRERIVLVADTSLSGASVTRELDTAITNRGRPLMIVSDNGTDFTQHGHPTLVSTDSDRVALYRSRQAVAECFRGEFFNGRLRDELLNETLFSSLDHARSLLA